MNKIELVLVNPDTRIPYDDETIDVSVEDFCAFVQAADDQGMSLSQWIEHALLMKLLDIKKGKKNGNIRKKRKGR